MAGRARRTQRASHPTTRDRDHRLAAVGYAGYLGYNYRKICVDFQKAGATTAVAKVADDGVSEVGYIFDMRHDTYLKRAEWNLVWFIVVPSTNMRYSASYENGYQDFKIGQVVNIIHTRNDIDLKGYSDDGYVVGLYDRAKGEAAHVNINDLEELMMEDTSE